MNTEIKLAVAELKEALPGLSRVTTKGRSLPVLQTIRINRNQEGTVTLQATDLDSFVTYRLAEPQQGLPGDVLVPMEQLVKAAKCSAPKEQVGIIPEANDKVRIRYNIAGNVVEQTISTLPVGDFPPTPDIKQTPVPLEPQFGRALKEALECSSDNDSRRVLNGACLDVKNEKFHYIVGTNGQMLFSANSFGFTLEKSVIIPDSKFLTWSDFLEDQPAFISVEPGQEAKPAKDGEKAQEAVAGWVKLQSPRWTFVTREIEGEYPNWKQCVPAPNSKWTQILLSDDAIAQLLVVIPNLPGAESSNHLIQLRVGQQLTVAAQNREDQQWTSIPVQNVTVVGEPVEIALNREYLLRGLRFGLNKLEIEDSLTPVVLSKGGKKMVIVPLRLEEPKAPASIETNAAPAPESQATDTPPQAEPVVQQERKRMPRKTTEGTSETQNPETQNNGDSGIKSLVDYVEQIKENLKGVLRDLSQVIDTVKQVEKERKASDKDIEAIRTKLRQIQNVSI